MTVQYLIDSENVGDFWIPLLELPDAETELIVFYTKNSPHMSYDSLIRLKESDKKVTFIKCYEGTNALDFQLVSELGYRICQNEDGRFVIVTNDTGYDAAVKYWRRRKRSVKRITGKECRNLDRRLREDIYGSDSNIRTPRAPRSVLRDAQEEGEQEPRLSRPNLRDVEAAAQEVLEEEASFRAGEEPEDFPEDVEEQTQDASGEVSMEFFREDDEETSKEDASKEDTSKKDTSKEDGKAPYGSAEDEEEPLEDSEEDEEESPDDSDEDGEEFPFASLQDEEEPLDFSGEASMEASFEDDGSNEDASNEDASNEDASNEDASYEDASYEDASYEDASYEDTSYEDASYEDASFSSEEEDEDASLYREELEGISIEEDEESEDLMQDPDGDTESILAGDGLTVGMHPYGQESPFRTEDSDAASSEDSAPESAEYPGAFSPEKSGLEEQESAESASAESVPEEQETAESVPEESVSTESVATESVAEKTVTEDPGSMRSASEGSAPEESAPEDPASAGFPDESAANEPALEESSLSLEASALESSALEESALEESALEDMPFDPAQVLPFFPDEIEEPGESAESGHRAKSRRTRSRRSRTGAKKQETQDAAQTVEPSVTEAGNKSSSASSRSRRKKSDSEQGGKSSAGKPAEPSPASAQQTDEASAQPPRDEIARIAACIGADNLAELHNQLATFYGDRGKDIYLSIKNGTRSLPDLHPDLKQKFSYYCEIIFAHSEEPEELPADMAEYLLSIREKLGNLNSLRYALIKRYGKEKGRRFYFLLKPYAKAMHQM